MNFELTPAQKKLQAKCLELAADFASRSPQHDRDASHPTENYDILRREGFLHLTIPQRWGGTGHDFLTHTIAYEALGRGCPSTALAFNMHASVVMPLLESDEVGDTAKQKIADLVVTQGKLLSGNFSEPGHTSLIGERPLSVRARPVEGGYSISGRKMFASMLGAADFVLVLVHPEGTTGAAPGMLAMIPPNAPGRNVVANWDTLGMRATRSDSMILDNCFVPDDAVLYRAGDIRRFRTEGANWFWASYTPVYLGLAGAAFGELKTVLTARHAEGYAQSLAWHPDSRRHVAELSVDLHAARLTTYYSAWLRDRDGPTPEAQTAMFRAKYLVGQATSRIVRTALTLGGAHGIFKGSRIEQLFRDGALAEIQPPQSDFCLWNVGLHELGLDPAEALPPMRPA